jgi:hypothetical protein
MTEQPTPRAIVEDRATESLTQAAAFTSEGARIVCHHRLSRVPTVYAIVAEFYTAAFAMETAIQNMSADLSRMLAAGDLYDTHPDGDPAACVDRAKLHLEFAIQHAAQLGRALQQAQNEIASVGHNA